MNWAFYFAAFVFGFVLGCFYCYVKTKIAFFAGRRFGHIADDEQAWREWDLE